MGIKQHLIVPHCGSNLPVTCCVSGTVQNLFFVCVKKCRCGYIAPFLYRLAWDPFPVLLQLPFRAQSISFLGICLKNHSRFAWKITRLWCTGEEQGPCEGFSDFCYWCLKNQYFFFYQQAIFYVIFLLEDPKARWRRWWNSLRWQLGTQHDLQLSLGLSVLSSRYLGDRAQQDCRHARNYSSLEASCPRLPLPAQRLTCLREHPTLQPKRNAPLTISARWRDFP